VSPFQIPFVNQNRAKRNGHSITAITSTAAFALLRRESDDSGWSVTKTFMLTDRLTMADSYLRFIAPPVLSESINEV
jgi:hypothetical protein